MEKITFEAIGTTELRTDTHGWVTLGELIGSAIDYINKSKVADWYYMFRGQEDEFSARCKETPVVELGDFLVADRGELQRRVAHIGILVYKSEDVRKREFTIYGIDFCEGDKVRSIEDMPE